VSVGPRPTSGRTGYRGEIVTTIHPGLCQKCGRPKSKNGTERGRPRYACRRVECRRRSTPPTPEQVKAARPWCVRCRRAMTGKGGGRLRCVGCGVTCALDRTPRRAYISDRPDCPECGRAMTLNGSSRKYFRCQHRDCARLGRQRREAAAAALLESVTSRLPRYLTADEREDARQSIVLDLLSGELSPDELTTARLRRYAARAVSLVRSPKFISLSQRTPDGRELGETIAA
jgi:hypothetical protein